MALSWVVKNNTSSPVILGFQGAAVLQANQQATILDTDAIVVGSSILRNAIRNGSVTVYKYCNGTLVAVIVGSNLNQQLTISQCGTIPNTVQTSSSTSGNSTSSGGSGISGYSGYSGYSGISGYSGGLGKSGYSGYSGYSGLNGAVGIGGYSGYSGAVGTSGISGYSGYSGLNGITGASGISGYSGYSGISGYSGYSGLNGTVGISGYSGYSGAVGTSGYSGYSGAVGISGYSGTVGASGISGYSGYSGYSGLNGTVGASGYSGYSGAVGVSGYSGYSGSFTTQASNTFFAGPSSGSAAAPTWRTIVAADVPTLFSSVVAPSSIGYGITYSGLNQSNIYVIDQGDASPTNSYNGAVIGYDVQYSTDGSTWKDLAGTTGKYTYINGSSFVGPSYTSGTQYVQVRAVPETITGETITKSSWVNTGVSSGVAYASPATLDTFTLTLEPGATSSNQTRINSVGTSAIAQAQLQTIEGNPLGWWKFDEGSGTTVSDSAGTYASGSLTGTPSWVSGVIGGSALNFNSSSQYASLGTTPLNVLSTGSIAMWVVPSGSGVNYGGNAYNNTTIIAKGNIYFSIMQLTTNHVRFYYYTGSTNYSDSTGALTVGSTTTSANFTQPAVGSTVSVTFASTSWMAAGTTLRVAGGGTYTVSSITSGTVAVLKNTGAAANVSSGSTASSGAAVAAANHVALTWNSSGASLWINGSLDSTTTNTPANMSASGNGLQLYVAYAGSGFGQYFGGIVDDLRIYNRILSSSEVGNLAGNFAYPIIPTTSKVCSSGISTTNDVTISIPSTSTVALTNNSSTSNTYTLSVKL